MFQRGCTIPIVSSAMWFYVQKPEPISSKFLESRVISLLLFNPRTSVVLIIIGKFTSSTKHFQFSRNVGTPWKTDNSDNNSKENWREKRNFSYPNEVLYPDSYSADHGYDNHLESMHTVFFARGPSFKANVTVPAFEITEYYNLFCGKYFDLLLYS